ncbi:MAG: hypothetical protein JSU63_05540 [Phycisphaerales bacterium]|nr:MAG: hypothetical protein JSU63_05540 [Phycisphaerales bacterium]
MDFLRRQLFYIVCALASIAGIALAFTGLGAMPDVVREMEKAKQTYDQLIAAGSQPVNEAHIELENERIESTRADHDRVVEKVAELAHFSDPLVKEAFPSGNDNARRRFRTEYERAMQKLFETLSAGGPASETEIELWREKKENEDVLARETGTVPGGPELSGPRRTPAGVLTPAGVRENPEARASINVARRILCYAVHFTDTESRRVASLDFHPEMRDIGTMDAPWPEDVWRAQVGYWIQKDIVESIVAVNNEAAEAAKQRGEHIWVGIMPVKDVISIRVSDYIISDDENAVGYPAGGSDEALPCGNANMVFTHSVTNPLYDVVQFTLKLVMDQRDIPRLVKEITQDSFHTLLRVSYVSVPPNRNMRGKIYGSEPTVNVVLDFETIMLARLSRRFMPQEVCDLYDEIDCPNREAEGEETED